MENHNDTSAPKTDTPLLQLAKDYIGLGGKRRAVVDDNVVSTRDWEPDSSTAAAFWKERIATLGADERKQVELYLPTINAT
jgi:hypothetical protein